MAFNRGGGFRGRSGGGGGRGFSGRRDFDRPQMHSAICSNCGKECEVPFKPTGEKPVFCSDCFEQQGGGRRENRDSRPFRRDSQERGSNDSQLKEQLDALNIKLDKILDLLSETPTEASEE